MIANSPIKTALIGYGFSANTFHIPFITTLAEFELVAISSSQKALVTEDWPKVTHYASAQTLLQSSDAELVIITAPNAIHFELAKLALQHGKHVIIEKPFVTTVAQGNELIALAKQEKRVLSVYHNRRWDGDFLTVKAMLDTGRFGHLRSFESHFDRFRPQVRQRWREQATIGGGLLLDLGPHLIDQAITLFGLPEAITAQCLITRENSSNVDYFNIIMHYPNLLATLHSDLFHAGPNKRFTLKGDLGSYEKYGLDPQEQRLVAGTRPSNEEWSKETPEQYGRFYSGQGDETIATALGGYQHYFTAVASAIRFQTPLPVEAEDALWGIKLIEIAMESSRLGKTIAVEQ